MTFGDAGAVDTTATFSTYGVYVLKLAAYDGTNTTEDEVTIFYRDPAAVNQSPVQIYYVTVPEYDGLVALDTINGAAGRPVYTYFSIAVATDGAYVYYDQWENGYASDISQPTSAEVYNAATNPGGVQIWGNGSCADGYPPNKRGIAAPVPCTAAWDGFIAGDVVIPDNAVNMDFTPNANYNLDTFSSNSYSNNNGTQAFGCAGCTGGGTDVLDSWTEYNTGENSATSGVIYVSGGQLVFNQTQSDGARDWIARRSSAPTGNVCAELSFDLSTNGQVEFDGTDRLGLIGRDSSGTPGWATWRLMGVNDVDPSGRIVVDLPHFTNYADFGFVSYDSLETGEQWLMDNVRGMGSLLAQPVPVLLRRPRQGRRDRLDLHGARLLGQRLRHVERHGPRDVPDRGVGRRVPGPGRLRYPQRRPDVRVQRALHHGRHPRHRGADQL